VPLVIPKAIGVVITGGKNGLPAPLGLCPRTSECTNREEDECNNTGCKNRPHNFRIDVLFFLARDCNNAGQWVKEWQIAIQNESIAL
jgi:hypothetical protein